MGLNLPGGPAAAQRHQEGATVFHKRCLAGRMPKPSAQTLQKPKAAKPADQRGKAAKSDKADKSGKPIAAQHADVLRQLGLDPTRPMAASSDGVTWFGKGPERVVRTPIDRSVLGTVRDSTTADYERVVAGLVEAFPRWRTVPAPKRGELVRRWADKLRQLKEPLGLLVSLETGKSLTEGRGEVQEMIDICDFAVGLSRTVGGKTLPSERQDHRIMEQWHPLGVVGVITAFNFPVAVYAWNAAIALVCGDVVLWKPSEKTPLTAVAVQRILAKLAASMGFGGITGLVVGGVEVGQKLVDDRRVPLVSATGSTRMGKQVGPAVAARMGRTILELGGNNAILVTPSADLALASRAILFGAVGTAGQRCTSTRRVFLHRSIAKDFTAKLAKAYSQVKVGDSLDASNHMGPLIDE